MSTETIRIDKLLFYVRLAKSRSLAAIWAEASHIRVNGRRIERSSFLVKVNDVVTLPRGDDVLAFKLLSIPARRGAPVEAQSSYRILA